MSDYPFTFKCNQNCISCINNLKTFSNMKDPPLDSIKEAIRNIDPNNDYFGVGGGEPTLRREFFEILKYARKTHPSLYIFITSNGRMFYYEDFAKKLRNLNLGNYLIGVSIYGHKSDLHDSITRTKGSFEQTTKGIKNLLKFNIPVEVRVIINKMNYKSLPEITKFVSEEFSGVSRFVFVNIKYTGNAFFNRDKVFVRIKDVVPYAEKAAKILIVNKINTRFFHFPLCMLSEDFRDLAKGVTKDTEELTFVDCCNKCNLKENCPMIWKTYIGLCGSSEFSPIKN